MLVKHFLKRHKMQESELDLNFSRQVMDMSIVKNRNDIETAIKKHLNFFFNELIKDFPEVYNFSWQQDNNKVYLDKYWVKVNDLNYQNRKWQKEQINENKEYVMEGTIIKKMTLKERYPLFINQILKDDEKLKNDMDKLEQACAIFSEELQKIGAIPLLVAFGNNISITVSRDKFHYSQKIIPVDSCDG